MKGKQNQEKKERIEIKGCLWCRTDRPEEKSLRIRRAKGVRSKKAYEEISNEEEFLIMEMMSSSTLVALGVLILVFLAGYLLK